MSLVKPLDCFILNCILHSIIKADTVELEWLEHLWDYENMFETGVDRAIASEQEANRFSVTCRGIVCSH